MFSVQFVGEKFIQTQIHKTARNMSSGETGLLMPRKHVKNEKVTTQLTLGTHIKTPQRALGVPEAPHEERAGGGASQMTPKHKRSSPDTTTEKSTLVPKAPQLVSLGNLHDIAYGRTALWTLRNLHDIMAYISL